MPVLKVKKNGVWEEIMGGSDSGSLNGGNADTLDGYHASNFALAGHTHSGYATSNHVHLGYESDINSLNYLVGDTPVSAQIDNALANFSSGKTLTEHFTEEPMILTSLQYGDELPPAGTPGRIFFKRVSS